MRSRWKTSQDEIESASRFHNKVRDILCGDPRFSSLKCFQEVPVSDLVPGYPHTNHHVDWYIDTFQVVVELHGRQHYQMTNFGNIPYRDAMIQFRELRYRDSLKKEALERAGYWYIEVPYTVEKQLDGDLLWRLITNQGDDDEDSKEEDRGAGS